ncbi:hypothetical protein ABH926_007083 [Catenulispora sp. GP43]|uniref:hypothetical protein n=1 Tax=Catenulispora sp. GP43 TaxID=3156263 RepID=UPI00351972EC
MTTKKTSSADPWGNRGNYVAEFYGRRLYPVVATSESAVADQGARRCPFLTTMVGTDTGCTKTAKGSLGVCTISSVANGVRLDWPVCPIRILDTELLREMSRRLFGYAPETPVGVVAANALKIADKREELLQALKEGIPTVVFFHGKLGGEIAMSKTTRSPAMSFDVTMIELLPSGEGFTFGRYGIFEIQTMDFHGSYETATSELAKAMDDPARDLTAELAQTPTPGWLGSGIETPNLSNVFKRTFYQMMFKFQLGGHGRSAGCIFAIPRPVWDSWQPHLGAPTLTENPDGTWQLGEPSLEGTAQSPTWIYVFDVEETATVHPNRIKPWKVIATDASTLSRYALDVAPAAALEPGGAADRIMITVEKRLRSFWKTMPIDDGQDSLFS